MRIVVQGASVERRGPRLALAVAGLATRGHEVVWLLGAPPAATDVRRIESLGALPGRRADVIVAGGAAWRGAALGWRLHARALLLGVDAESVARFSVLDRWAWESLSTLGLLEEAEADAVRAAVTGLPLEQFALWSGAAPPRSPDPAHPDVELLERAAERALARQAGGRRGAVFVDRDGTLVVERGYLSDPDGVELLPGVAGALRAVRAAGMPVIVVSNQAGVGRGLFPLAQVYATMAMLRRRLRAEGVELDGIYFCPHRPDEDCDCRKPKPGLLERAAADHGLDLRASVMIGDKLLDAATGQAAGGAGVLVRTGYGRDEESQRAGAPGGRAPDATFDTFAEAAAWAIARREA